MKTAIALSLLSAISAYSASAASIEGCYATDSKDAPLVYIKNDTISYKLSPMLVKYVEVVHARFGLINGVERTRVAMRFESPAKIDSKHPYADIPMAHEAEYKYEQGTQATTEVSSERSGSAKVSAKIIVNFNPLKRDPSAVVRAQVQSGEPRSFDTLIPSKSRDLNFSLTNKIANSVCERAGL